MTNRHQRSGVRDQRPEIGHACGRSAGAEGRRSGFTLVEVLLSTVIAVLVFAAMGAVLGKGFSLWMDGTTHWHLAQQSRVARARMLSGPQGPGTGVLSISQVNAVDRGNDWSTLKYHVSATGDEFWLRGFVTEASQANQSLFIKNNDTGEESWAIIVGQKGNQYAQPDISTSSFDAQLNGDVLTLDYVMRYRRGGRLYEQPQQITAHLVNKNNPGYYVGYDEDPDGEDGGDDEDDDGEPGNGNDDDDGDHDRGHGNDPDGHDEDNPGNGGGNPGNGNGNGNGNGGDDWWNRWWNRWRNR
jgi:hypothetical protein